MRNFKKLKTIEDYSVLDAPVQVYINDLVEPPKDDIRILRMLVRPKYSEKWSIPPELHWLKECITDAQETDKQLTGIKHSFCYVTVRHGVPFSMTDDEWHFDGSSFRTDLIPERNYIWVNHTPTEFKTGKLNIPVDFDPVKYNLFTFAAGQLEHEPIRQTKAKEWFMMSPFCLHRRPKLEPGKSRTFIRICFTDIEGRDINNTQNPLLETDAYGRDPVKTYRNNLEHYKFES